MRLAGTTAVVTGAGGGIGAAIATRLVDAGVRVVVADIDAGRATETAARIGGSLAVGVGADVAQVDGIQTILDLAQTRFGPVDLYCANAGIVGALGLGDRDLDWEHAIDVNLLAHVRAARLLIPGWLARGSGYFVSTASAAGLLTQIGAAPYSVTKHAALAFSEWLSITYGDQGIRVSCLCPMGVNTQMLTSGLQTQDSSTSAGATVVANAGVILEPDEVASSLLKAIEADQFLVLPHPEVLAFFRNKSADYERWLRGMRRLQTTAKSSAR